MSKPFFRILHTEASCGWGGQEIRILTESEGMIARGHSVSIACCSNAKIFHEAKLRNIPVIALPFHKKSVSNLIAITKWLKQNAHHFDIVNTHSSGDAWLIALANLLLRKKTPIMIRTRHVSTKVNRSWGTRWLYLKASKHIITTGQRLRETLHIQNNYPLSHMTSVPTGIDLDFFIPQEKTLSRQKIQIPNKPTLGILATLRSWKGHTFLLEAWKTLHQEFPQWQLLIVGDGPQRESLTQKTKDMQLSSSVIFLGNRDDTADCLNSMDIFVLPSYGNEGVPQSIMQAMACGLPVVSTTVGAIDEIVISNKTGYLVEPKNTEVFIEKLRELMGNIILRKNIGDAALAHAKMYFGSEIMLNKMTEVFSKIAMNNELQYKSTHSETYHAIKHRTNLDEKRK